MSDLAEIARGVASASLSDKKTSELLNGYLDDLNNLLQRSKLKALVVDTFGSRIGNLLR